MTIAESSPAIGPEVGAGILTGINSVGRLLRYEPGKTVLRVKIEGIPDILRVAPSLDLVLPRITLRSS